MRKSAVLGITLALLALLPPGESSGNWTDQSGWMVVWTKPLLESSCQITWTSKRHLFDSAAHHYSFTGHFLQEYCLLDDHKCIPSKMFRKKLEFAVEASYYLGDARLMEKATILVPNGIGPGTVTCADPGARCDRYEMNVERRGTGVTVDPWITPAQVVQGWDIRESNPWANFPNNGIPPFPPSHLFSSCAFTDAERVALTQEAGKGGTCTVMQLFQPPALYLGVAAMGQPIDGHFAAPEDASVLLVIDCLPAPAGDASSSRFVVDVEKREWDNERYGFFWDRVRGDVLADMFLNETQNKASGVLRLGLSGAGAYRVRAKSVVRVLKKKVDGWSVAPVDIASAYTPWAAFTAGETGAENLHAGATKAQAQAFSGVGAPSAQPRRPDLVVDDFQAPAAGQGVLPRWRVRNVGTGGAPAADLLVCCRSVGQGACPEAFGTPTPDWDRCGLLRLEDELYPKPEGAPGSPGGGSWVSLASPIPAPTGLVRYRLSATVDSAKLIQESVEDNNEFVSFLPAAGAMVSSQGAMNKPAGELIPVASGGAALQKSAKQQGVVAAPAPQVASLAPAPAVVVRSLGFEPAKLRAGEQFSMKIEFANGGPVASSATAAYSLTCSIVSGAGPCPFTGGAKPYGAAIAPGASLPVTLPAVATAAGTYRVEIKPLPERLGVAKALTFTLPPRLLQDGSEATKKNVAPTAAPIPATTPVPAQSPAGGAAPALKKKTLKK